MTDNIFEELQKYEAPKSLPPIADQAFAVYEAAGFVLEDDGLDALRSELKKYVKEDDLKPLTDAIVGLGAFGIYLRDIREDHEAAEKIARLITEHSPKYEPIGARIFNALKDLQLKASDLFDELVGRDKSLRHTAPKYGEEGPEGTVPLKDIKPVGQEPPLKERMKKTQK